MEILKKQIFDASELADILEVSVDPSLDREDRIAEFRLQIGDPHHFRCGDIVVHAHYAQDGPSLTDRLKQLIN